MQYEDKIDDFLADRLKGKELAAFDEALQKDKSLVEALAFRMALGKAARDKAAEEEYAAIKASVAAKERNRLWGGLSILGVLLLGLGIFALNTPTEIQNNDTSEQFSSVELDNNKVLDTIENTLISTENISIENERINDTQQNTSPQTTKLKETISVEPTVQDTPRQHNNPISEDTIKKEKIAVESENTDNATIAKIESYKREEVEVFGTSRGASEDDIYTQKFKAKAYQDIITALDGKASRTWSDSTKIALALSYMHEEGNCAKAQPLLQNLLESKAIKIRKMAEWFYTLCLLSAPQTADQQAGIARLRAITELRSHSQKRKAEELLQLLE